MFMAAVSVPTAKQPAAEADQQRPDPEQPRGIQRRGEDHRGEGDDADQHAVGGQPIGSAPRVSSARRQREGHQRAEGPDGRQPGRLGHRQPQHLGAIGLKQDLLHRETGGAEPERDQQALGTGRR
jgi:hypothetical protein